MKPEALAKLLLLSGPVWEIHQASLRATSPFDLRLTTPKLLTQPSGIPSFLLNQAKAPDGPTAKFLVLNIHTMDELKLTGNHLKGSRAVLSFDAGFDQQPHLQLLKELLGQIFGTPKNHHKTKPFFDHVMSFSLADGCVWLRNYQVCLGLDSCYKVVTMILLQLCMRAG